MREKEPLPYVVEKYIQFISDVKEFGQTDQFTLTQLIGAYKINKTVRKALVELSIINLQSNKFWHWLSFDADRKLALTILNFINERSKKQRTTPIAGMEDLVTAIKHNTEALSRFSGLNRLKTSDTVKEVELFTIDSQRLQVYCAIVSGLYSNAQYNDLLSGLTQGLNELAITATDHSISLLLNKA